MTDMIEKCAAVLFEWFDDEYQGAYRPSFSDLSDSQKEMYLNVMREVFEVMKVPSDEMMQAAIDSGADDFGGMGIRDYQIAFTAAIDAALGEQEE